MQKLSGPMLPPRSGEPPKQAVVMLHGYGADGSDLIGLGHHWGTLLPDAIFLAPNAPTPCAGNAFGFEWFPLQVDRIADSIAGARQAAPIIIDFLTDLWTQTGLRPEDTFVVGFSQGAILALNAGTGLERRLKGIVAFAGAFPPPDDFASGRFAKPPIALIHGDMDQVVDPEFSRRAARNLTAAGFDVTLHLSPDVGHGIAPDGLDVATAFLLAQND